MRRITDKRTVIWGVAAIIAAAAFLLATAVAGDAVESDQQTSASAEATTAPVIDTAAPIEPTQCAPCHLDLGNVTQPGLIFSHGNHMLVSCDGCHARMPHRGSGTETVPMEVCFTCHGIAHGPQGELASSECRDCHTKSFVLRPKTHTEDWKAKPHADKANKTGVNDCMMCHDAPKDCDECHEKENVDVGKMPDAYHSLVQPRDKGPSVKVYPDGPVSMSQCQYCHPDLDEITPGRLIFAHGAHLRAQLSLRGVPHRVRAPGERDEQARHDVVLPVPQRLPQRRRSDRRGAGLLQVPPEVLRAHAQGPHDAVHQGRARQEVERGPRRTARCATRPSSASAAIAARR